MLYLFKQSISYRLVFIIWFFPHRDHRKGVIKIRQWAVCYFSLDTVECEHARGASGESARNEGWLVYFSHCIGVLVLVFLLSSVLFHNSDGVTDLFFLKHCTLLPTTLEMGKIKNWTYFYGKCPAKNAGNGISVILNLKNFLGEHAPIQLFFPAYVNPQNRTLHRPWTVPVKRLTRCRDSYVSSPTLHSCGKSHGLHIGSHQLLANGCQRLKMKVK